jgi:ATP/maltotriose-dependent transcriptional regulator MalT
LTGSGFDLYFFVEMERILNAEPRELMDGGKKALARGNWGEARTQFEEAVGIAETAEALEGLGMAAWWQDDARVTLGSRERAFHLYRQRKDVQGAARMAAYLGYDYFSFRGEYAVANGWLQRGYRLLEGLENAPERALLAVYEGYLALLVEQDAKRAEALGAMATRIGHSLGSIDLEMLGLALKGMAQVSGGDVAAGMRCLDESTAAAVSGEMQNPDCCATACCYLIYACELVRDYDRAAQWCAYMKDYATRWNYPMMLSLCRTHYAGVLLWRGNWQEAEATLLSATGELTASRPAEASEGIVRLAELRRRQGRYDEASALLEQAESHPFRFTGANLARLCRATLALERGDAPSAAEQAEHYLRGLREGDRTDCAAGLEVLALAQLALGKREKALAALEALRTIANKVATEPLRAGANYVEGIAAAANGEFDAAIRFFEDAIDLYVRCGARYETARARGGLARSLQALGQYDAARQQAQEAFIVFEELGAVPEKMRSKNLCEAIEKKARNRKPDGQSAVNLTPRERQVLCLIAEGRSNADIAEELVLSIRTVERHTSSIYSKIGVSGTTARAGATAYAIRNGILTA